ncbi:hypothetical protein [Streptomyces goshikiensis]|uniref:hypothetical protein n=1 Tax=Streptomyces goshikiensis TaxID=1942 RepID=UPI0036C9C73A
MSIALDFPEFPFEEPPGSITCQQKPWNGVLVRVDHYRSRPATRSPSTSRSTAKPAKSRGVTADTTSVSYTIPWEGALDAVAEGSITVFYTLTPADGSTPSTSQEAMVQYSRRQPGGTVCGPES